MTPPIQLTFRYLESDYVKALRTHYKNRLRLPLDIAVCIVLAGLGAYLWRSTDRHHMGVTLVVLAVSFALFLLAAFFVIPPLVFRRELKFRDEYSLTFSAEDIHFRTISIDSRLQWSLYTHALIDDHSCILYYGKRQFTIIPKRVFQSADQLQAFEDLLARHITKITRQNP